MDRYHPDYVEDEEEEEIIDLAPEDKQPFSMAFANKFSSSFKGYFDAMGLPEENDIRYEDHLQQDVQEDEDLIREDFEDINQDWDFDDEDFQKKKSSPTQVNPMEKSELSESKG